ncbi:MAG: CDC48 family AAA ATPase [Chloroflexi bacterium]|nr:CDC48 family AAA ATPase [Chloroflexota bacterium]
MAENSGCPLSLTVAEALPRDAGRGIARMDPKDMASLGVQVGDIVQVVGKRATAAKVMPTYPKDRDKGLVQVCGITRQNAQVGLGEAAQVQASTFQEASSIVLVPSTPSRAFAPGRDPRYLGRLLERLPLTQGDRIRATFPGGRYLEFVALEVSPSGVVVVGSRTAIRIKGDGGPAREKSGVTYEDVGGLRRELQKIREIVELPLKHPELFERLGIDPPKGVLLHGPPGCGKTLIARAVANETDAAFFHISGPEVIHKFYGESEAHLRAIFEKAAQQAPAIIFIDEIDAVAAKREDVRGDQQVERRVVAQLLALMDGLKGRGQVIVIGATNLPQVLDPALRRPGRFDREIIISVPDRSGRLEVLQVHTRGMPLAEDVSVETLAEMTHGFVGADLAALCREAAMTTLRKVMPRLQAQEGGVSPDLLTDIQVTMADFLEAFKEVEPSAIREVFTEVPDVAWEDVGGLGEAKQVLMETIVWPVKHPEAFRQLGTAPPKGILLSGPPGTGKTLLAKAVATQSGVNFISVKGPALLSKRVGESEKGVREVFKKAKQASPCIIFFDEIDALAPGRGSGGDSGVTERVLSQLLTEMDGVEELKGVTVLAATNRPDLLDPALLRAGRFDAHVRLPLPDQKARREILAIHTRGKPLADDVDLDRLAGATEGLAGADIAGICRRASMLALRELLDRDGQAATPAEIGTLKVLVRHFDQALAEARGQPG